MWILYGLLAAFFAALMTLTAKIGLKNIDPTFATGVRSGIMFLFMLGVLTATQKWKNFSQLEGRAWVLIVLAGVFGALSWLFYFIGLRDVSASKLAALDRLSLPLIVLGSTLFLAEKATWPLIGGSVLVTAGALLMTRG